MYELLGQHYLAHVFPTRALYVALKRVATSRGRQQHATCLEGFLINTNRRDTKLPTFQYIFSLGQNADNQMCGYLYMTNSFSLQRTEIILRNCLQW